MPTTFPKLRERVLDSSAGEAGLRTRLAALEVELAAGGRVQAARGDVLRKLGERDAAMAAYRAALADNVTLLDARFGLAGLLAASGDELAAIAEWEGVATADATDLDALFNIGIARYRRGEFAEALAAWDRAAERAPADFWIARKRVQAVYALGHYAAGEAARARVKALWRTSNDRAVQLQDEIVFDQFGVGAVHVYAAEPLRERGPEAYPVLGFRVIDLVGGQFEVAIETSEYGRTRGTPFVLSVLDAGRYHVIGTQAVMPPYGELKATVTRLVEQAITARRSTNPR